MVYEPEMQRFKKLAKEAGVPTKPRATPPVLEAPRKTFAPAPAPTGFGVDEWLQQQGAGLPPTPPVEPERGFWPWETPAGEGFLMPWEPTPQPMGAAGMPEGWWASPFEVPPEVSANYDIVYDPDMMAWRVGGTKAGAGVAGVSALEEELARAELALDERLVVLREEEAVWKREQAGKLTSEQEEYYRLQYAKIEEDRARLEAQLAQQMSIAQMQQEGVTPQWRPGELGLQQQQLAQQQQYQQWQMAEAQRQYGAQLAAQPKSWLEYAAYTGEQPAIQPWMLPLMPQQYGQLGAGAAIPGYGAESMAGMPELMTPSRQYQARMGPTAQQQFLGYRQARTGVTPEEQQFRLWSAAPPGGQYRGLTYSR